MHDELLRALKILELAPGAGWSDIVARFRHLAKVWHPDRFLTPKDKAIAEEKLKQIIAAKELLQAHFQSNAHKIDGYCICWGMAPQPPPATPPPARQAQPDQPAQSATPKPPPPEPPQKNKKTPWDWANDLLGYLDLGPIKPGEPFWLETFRRHCDSILGKHPGDTALDYWSKATSWTKDHKRRCLLWGFLIIVTFDRLAAQFGPPVSTTVPGTAVAPTTSAPTTSAPTPIRRQQSSSATAVDFDSPAEIESERLYFERKWKEREDLLQRIRPGYKPSGG